MGPLRVHSSLAPHGYLQPLSNEVSQVFHITPTFPQTEVAPLGRLDQEQVQGSPQQPCTWDKGRRRWTLTVSKEGISMSVAAAVMPADERDLTHPG